MCGVNPAEAKWGHSACKPKFGGLKGKWPKISKPNGDCNMGAFCGFPVSEFEDSVDSCANVIDNNTYYSYKYLIMLSYILVKYIFSY